jgi:hypothetical protein
MIRSPRMFNVRLFPPARGGKVMVPSVGVAQV